MMQKEKVRVNIPVTLSIIVPVEVEHEVDPETLSDGGFLDADKCEDWESIAASAAEIAASSEEIAAALDTLHLAVQHYRIKHPAARATINPFLGIAEDLDV